MNPECTCNRKLFIHDSIIIYAPGKNEVVVAFAKDCPIHGFKDVTPRDEEAPASET